MNERHVKTARLLLALLLLLAWALPACAGSDGCTMPCCRAKANAAPGAGAKPCCRETGAAACRLSADCPYAHPRALTPVVAEAPAAGLSIAAVVADDASLPGNTPAVPPARSGPRFDSPVYLRTLSLLI